MNLFLTGTDTDVGKTYVATLLVRALRQQGVDCVGMKPICCGDRADAEVLHAASGARATLNDVNPVWLRTPAAPYVAAMIESRAIDVASIKEKFSELRRAHQAVVVEGAGGWLVPIERDYFVSDLAADFGLPVAVVVGNRLGALNHALLTVRSIRARNLPCAGIILNHPQPPAGMDEIATATNRAMLETLADVPILFEVMHGQPTLTLPDEFWERVNASSVSPRTSTS